MTERHPIQPRDDVSEDELARVDELLRRLPPVEAPGPLVRETLRRVEARRSKPRVMWARGLAVVAGVAAAAVAVIGVRQVEQSEMREVANAPMADNDVAHGPSGRASGDLERSQGEAGWVPPRELLDSTGLQESEADGRYREQKAGDGLKSQLAQAERIRDLADESQVMQKLSGKQDQARRLAQGDVDFDGIDDTNLLGGEIAKNEKAREPADGVDGVMGFFGGDAPAQDVPRAGLLEEVAADVAESSEFIEARGYFANTYVPGDAEVRWLQAQVGAGLVRDGARVPLDELARPVVQPFDAPADKALALHLASDTAAVDGPRRVTLQLGLKGARQAPTRRSPLNVALVVDVAGIADDAERRALWSVAEAMAKSMQPEDRLTLVAAGEVPKVASAVGPAEVMRFLVDAYEGRRGAGRLDEALALAYREVRGGKRDDAPAGADLVVLATAAPLGELTERAHTEAVAGIQLSVIGVGPRVDAAGARALALAGQGRSTYVATADLAAAAVDNELATAGRAVARAVRLRVRLADGVGLVSVLGSRRLDAADTDKVRAAERAIDLKVAETTGIRADRGDDEDGIQIVIPAFMAGDDHVVLFDVVVPGPGPVMDVRARFKDLVTIGNGEVAASLSLGSGHQAPRAEQLNVTQNLVARRVADALGAAAARLQAGDPQGARQALVEGRRALGRIAAQADGLGRVALLAAYEAVLVDLASGDTARIASSMRLAARVELGAR